MKLAQVVLLPLFMLAIACEKKSGDTHMVVYVEQPAQTEGSSSGGGSFGNESSIQILKWAKEDLASQIRQSSPGIYRGLPASWTQEKLAALIDSTETETFPEISRYGVRLMFDYRKREDGTPYLTPTALFADAFSHFEVNSRPKHEFFYVIEEVKMKLLHEAAHHMGFGLTKESDMPEARAFAKALQKSFDTDNVECITLGDAPIGIFSLNEDKFSRLNPKPSLSRAYLFNRPTGKGVSPPSYETKACADGTNDCENPQSSFKLWPKWSIPGQGTSVLNYEHVNLSMSLGYKPYAPNEKGPFFWSMYDHRNAVRHGNGFVSGYNYNAADAYPFYSDFVIEVKSPKAIVANLIGYQNAPLLRDIDGTMRIEISYDGDKIEKVDGFYQGSFYKREYSDCDSNCWVPVIMERPLRLTCTSDYLPLEIPPKAKE